DVAAIGAEVENRVANQLSWSVIGHIPTAAGLEQVDAARREGLHGHDNVRRCAACFDAQCHNVRMFEQQQRIWNAIRTTLLDELALQREGVSVCHEAEASYLQGSHQRLTDSTHRRFQCSSSRPT